MSEESVTTYASVEDVQSRLGRSMTERESTMCPALLEDAALLIDACRSAASEQAKKTVSCRMVVRALGDGGGGSCVPMGASQGSMSALGYTQSWTMGSGGTTGELYLSKTDKLMLGGGNAIGSYSPVQEMVPEVEP